MLTTAEKQSAGLLHEINAGQPCLKCEDKCPGLEIHFWRKICINCKCPVSDHQVAPGDEGLIQVKIKQLDDNVRTQFECSSYSWIPPGLTPEVVEEFMKLLPPDKRPMVGCTGEQLRRKLLMTQLPAHDHNPKFCNNLLPTEAEELIEFSRLRYDLSYGVAEVRRVTVEQSEMFDCRNCCTPLDPLQLAIFTEKAGPSCIWCPACFVCDVCNETLVDLHYFYKDGGLYCGRHHAELLKPRCAACDELILSKEYTLAEQKNWHLNHFCCWNCDSPLGGSRYVTREDHPFCMSCYENLYAPTCEKCCSPIGVDSAQMVHKAHHWHATDICFYCECCEESLITRPFLLKFGEIFCSSPCAQKYSSNHSAVLNPKSVDSTPLIKVIEDNPVDKDLPSILRKDSSPTPPKLNGVSPIKRKVMFNVLESEEQVARSMSVEEFEQLEQRTSTEPEPTVSPEHNSESTLSLSPMSDSEGFHTPEIEITTPDYVDEIEREDEIEENKQITVPDKENQSQIILQDQVINAKESVKQTMPEQTEPELMEPKQTELEQTEPEQMEPEQTEQSKTPDISEMVDVMESIISQPQNKSSQPEKTITEEVKHQPSALELHAQECETADDLDILTVLNIPTVIDIVLTEDQKRFSSDKENTELTIGNEETHSNKRNSIEIASDTEIMPRKTTRTKLSSASFNRILKKIDCSGNEINLERPGKRLRNRPRSLSSLSSHHKGPYVIEQKESLVSMYALSPDVADMVASVYKSQNSKTEFIRREGSIELRLKKHVTENTPPQSPACSNYSSPHIGERSAHIGERSAHKRNPSYEAAEFVMQLDAESGGEEEKVVNEVEPLTQEITREEPKLKKSKSLKGRLSLRRKKNKKHPVDDKTAPFEFPGKKQKEKKACSLM